MRGGAVHWSCWFQPAASGISVWNAPLWVLAGMQRGSSLRSHHIGGSLGSSRASIVSMQVSIEDERSHKQSAASAEDAGSSMIVATARAGKRFLMKADPSPQSTARGTGRKECDTRPRYSIIDVGLAIEPGKPGISERSRSSRGPNRPS